MGQMKTEFSSNQFESAYPDGIEKHWWSLSRTHVLKQVIKSLVNLDQSVLEVGCGRGVVVKGLRDFGIKCNGVEISNVQPISSMEEHIITGKEASEIPNRDDYDVILLLDVLEHISEPTIFLKKLSTDFPNVNRIIVTVPAREELWSNYDEHYGHFKRYTIEMLDFISHNIKWKIEKQSYFFHTLYFPAWILTRIAKRRKIRINAPTGFNIILHKLFSYVMIFDYILLPSKFIGTSVLCCMKRRDYEQ